MLFGDLSENAIQTGLREMRDKGRDQDTRAKEDILAMYRGGPSVINLLQQRPKERDTKWAYRLSRFAMPNYLAFIVDYLARGLYGQQVMRTWEGGTDADNQALDLDLEENGIWDVQAEIAQSVVAAGAGWMLTKYDQFENRLVYIPVWPTSIEWEPDPDNPQRIRTLIETRRYLDAADNEKSFSWVWIDDKASGVSWGRVYDQDGVRAQSREGEGFDPNPYGLIPYTHWRGLPMIGMQDGLSVVRDIASMQKLLVNQLSDLVTLISYQSHGYPVRIMGEGEDPESSVLVGVDEMMTLANGGDFKFASPGASITEVLEAIDKNIDMMFHTAQLPREAMSGGVAESGVALRIRWQPYIAQTQAARMRAKQAEMRWGRVRQAVGRAHGVKGIPQGDKVRLRAQWDEAILPADDVAEWTMDLAAVNNEPRLMTLEDLLTKWREGVDTPEDAAKYLATIQAEAEKFDKKPEPAQTEGSPFDALLTNGNGGRF